MTGPSSSPTPAVIAGAPASDRDHAALLRTDDDRRALWLRLSMLPEELRRPTYLRLTIDGLVAAASQPSQVVTLDSGDVLAVFDPDRIDNVAAAARATCRLFGQPLEPPAGDGLRFVRWYDLPRDRAALQDDLSKDRERGHRTPPSVAENLAKRAQVLARAPILAPLTPAGFAGLVNALQRIDLLPLIRRQTAFAWPAGGAPAPRFDEVYVSMAAVCSTLFAGIDITADAFLFRHLTGILDLRLLASLSKSEAIGGPGEISINLNLGSVFSPEFSLFDDNLSAARIGTVIVEVPAVDVLADLPLFLRARDRLRELGYRIALDGIGWRDLPLVECGMLGVDLIKITASSDDLAATDHDRAALCRAVAAVGSHRLVMCRVDEAAAIDLGHAAGIEIFQGRHVDRRVSQLNRRRRGGLKRALPADT